MFGSVPPKAILAQLKMR